MQVTFLIGLACLGLAIGVFAGGSETPVIGTLLPLLFGLIGGASGFFVIGLDLSQTDSAKKLSLLGFSLIVFTIPTILSSIYMTLLRTHTSFADLLPATTISDEQVSLPEIYETAPSEYLRLILLRNKMSLVAIPRTEQATIFQNLSNQPDPAAIVSMKDIAARLSKLCASISLTLLDHTKLIKQNVEQSEYYGRVNRQTIEFLYYCVMVKDFEVPEDVESIYGAQFAAKLERIERFKNYIEEIFGDEEWLWNADSDSMAMDMSKLRLLAEKLHHAGLFVRKSDVESLESYLEAYTVYANESQALRELQELLSPGQDTPGFAIQSQIPEGRI